MSKKTGSTGASSQDLMLMRMLMANQQIPQMQVGPVNDLGSGIASAGQQILNALITRRNMAQNNQMMQAMLDQMRMQQEAEQANAEAQMQSIRDGLIGAGVDQNTAIIAAQSGDPSVINNALNESFKQQGIQRLAKAIYRQGLKPAFDPKTGNPILDEQGNQILQETIPLSAAMDFANMGPEMAQRMTATVLTNNLDLNSVAGINKFQQISGFKPTTPVDMVKNRADAISAGNQALISGSNAKFIDSMNAADLANKNATLGSINQDIVTKTINNQTLGQKNAQDLQQSAENIQKLQLDNTGRQAGLNLLNNSLKDGSFYNPGSNAYNAGIFAGVNGQNPFATVNDQAMKLANPKAGKSPIEQMLQIVPMPQAAPQAMPQEPQSNLSAQTQGALANLYWQEAMKAPGRFINKAQAGIINGTNYLNDYFNGFLSGTGN